MSQAKFATHLLQPLPLKGSGNFKHNDSDNEDEMETESVNEEPMPRKKAKANYDAISEASSSGGLIGEYDIILAYSWLALIQ